MDDGRWTTRLLDRPAAGGGRNPLGPPADPEAYRRLAVATSEFNSYFGPQLAEPAEELLDQLGEDSAPLALGAVVADVAAHVRKTTRRTL